MCECVWEVMLEVEIYYGGRWQSKKEGYDLIMLSRVVTDDVFLILFF